MVPAIYTDVDYTGTRCVHGIVQIEVENKFIFLPFRRCDFAKSEELSLGQFLAGQVNHFRLALLKPA